jgi:hypothetical protein
VWDNNPRNAHCPVNELGGPERARPISPRPNLRGKRRGDLMREPASEKFTSIGLKTTPQ